MANVKETIRHMGYSVRGAVKRAKLNLSSHGMTNMDPFEAEAAMKNMRVEWGTGYKTAPPKGRSPEELRGTVTLPKEKK